jgi:hypothetical protein
LHATRANAHRNVLLYFISRLPIIVAMKSWFRIGPDRGNEQDGPQPPERYSSAHSTVRLLDPFTVLALTGEGSTCEGSRSSGAPRLRALPLAPKPLLPRRPGLKFATNLSEIREFSDISTRFWSKSRSYRKQTIKPLLPGSRIARCVTGSLHDSRTLFVPAVFAPLGRPPAPWGAVTLVDVCYPCRGDTHEWATSNVSRVI